MYASAALHQRVASPASAFTNPHFYGREGIDCEATSRSCRPGSATKASISPSLRRRRRVLLVCPPCAGQRADPRVYRAFRPESAGALAIIATRSSASYEAMIPPGWAGEGVAFAFHSD